MAVLAGTTRAGAAVVSDPEGFRRLPKSIWVWNTEADELAALGDFANRWNISRALLGLRRGTVERLVAGDPKAQGAIEALRESGIEIMALVGDPSWVEQGNVPRSVTRIMHIAAHRKLFDGLDLDVEPHALPGWHSGDAQRQRLMAGHVALFETLAREAGGLPLGAALHPTYAKLTLSDGRNYLEALCRSLQSASLMAYRNNAAATVDWSAASISVFERTRTPWRGGVLVHQAKEANISYVGKEGPEFIADMVELDHRLHSLPSADSYRGLIFEDYKSLLALLRA
jgi:hypothetical protein